MPRLAQPPRHDVVVIGGGQNGLAASYHLVQAGIDHVVLERAEHVGDVWRSRYDSLRLYSPARYDALPGLPLAMDPMAFPTGRQMADYLEDYVLHFDLPVRTNVAVEHLRQRPDQAFEVATADGTYEAARIIIATGPFQRPYVPSFASELDPRIQQIHSADYRQPSQITDGPVLVVGASHSGADLAYELSASHKTYLAGRSHGQLPFSVDGRMARATWPLLRAVASKVLNLGTPIGRKMAPQVRMGGGPLLRHRRGDLLEAGVEWIEERVERSDAGRPALASGRVLDVTSILWCTGFRADFSWLEPDVLGDDGWPRQERGVVTGVPGLYVLGMPFQYSFASMLVTGAGPDAAYVVDHIRAATAPAPAPAATQVAA